MASLKKLSNFVRGDTPVLEFDFATTDGAPIDLTGYTAKITITSNPAPDNTSDALVQKATMTIEGNKARYQLPNSISMQFVPGQTYYGDVEITKAPAETNTYTPIRFTIMALQDYGV